MFVAAARIVDRLVQRRSKPRRHRAAGQLSCGYCLLSWPEPPNRKSSVAGDPLLVSAAATTATRHRQVRPLEPLPQEATSSWAVFRLLTDMVLTTTALRFSKDSVANFALGDSRFGEIPGSAGVPAVPFGREPGL